MANHELLTDTSPSAVSETDLALAQRLRGLLPVVRGAGQFLQTSLLQVACDAQTVRSLEGKEVISSWPFLPPRCTSRAKIFL